MAPSKFLFVISDRALDMNRAKGADFRMGDRYELGLGVRINPGKRRREPTPNAL